MQNWILRPVRFRNLTLLPGKITHVEFSVLQEDFRLRVGSSVW